MTTDEALTEQIARELFLHERWNFTDPRPQSEKTPEGDREMRDRMAARWDAEAGKPWHESEWPSFRQKYPRLAAAVLPIIRAREAEAWSEGEAAGHYNTGPRSQVRNPYRAEGSH